MPCAVPLRFSYGISGIRHYRCFLFQERLGSCVRLDHPAISPIPLRLCGS